MDAIDFIGLAKEKGVTHAISHCMAMPDTIADPALQERIESAQNAIDELIDYCKSVRSNAAQDIRNLGEVKEAYKSRYTFREYRLCGMPHRTNGPAKIKIRGRRGPAEELGSWYLFGTTTSYQIVKQALLACKIDASYPCYNRKKTIELALYMLKNYGDRKSRGTHLRRNRIIEFLRNMGEETLAMTLDASCELSL